MYTDTMYTDMIRNGTMYTDTMYTDMIRNGTMYIDNISTLALITHLIQQLFSPCPSTLLMQTKGSNRR
jgi:hypothetical protein